jgi:xanthine dehydrogenase YagR molybdenum-binding subunit
MTSRSLALIFHMKPDEVQVLAPFVGGGFGGKGSLWTHTPLCAAAAKAVNRPVKLSLSREGVYRMVGGRTRAEQRIALGAARDGNLTALLHTGTTATTSHALRGTMHLPNAAPLFVAEYFHRAEDRQPRYDRQHLDACSGGVDWNIRA